jgi:O-methyltransferase
MKQIEALREHYLKLLSQHLDGSLYRDLPMRWLKEYDPTVREHGKDWPSTALTMVGSKRLKNIRVLLESVILEKIPGDFVETGVWRGGASIFARAVLMAYDIADRKVICCDSFEGLPPPDEVRFPADKDSSFHTYPELAVTLEEVRENFIKFDLLDDQVVFLKGWFRDTMATVPSEQVAVLRLDGDMYESTIDPLRHLYDRIPDGGWVIVDDYHIIPESREALHDFLNDRGLKPTLQEIDGMGIFFRKNENAFFSQQ